MGVLILLVVLVQAAAQEPNATLRVEVRQEIKPVAEASVIVNGTTYRTDAEGAVSIPIQPGNVEIVVVKDGFSPVTTTLTVQSGQRRDVMVELQRFEEEVTVSATRTNTRLEDQPMRVEVLDREEIEEKLLMTPGDIAVARRGERSHSRDARPLHPVSF